MSDYAALLPPLADDEYASLKNDIAERGVLVPVEVDENGDVLDGAHRLRACEELGIDPPRVVRLGMTDAEKRSHAIALNLARRHLSREQRQPLVEKLRAEGWSTRRIAEAAGVSHETVRGDLEGVKDLTPERTTGKDGKSYPARRPHVHADTAKQAERIQEHARRVDPAELPAKRFEPKRFERVVREATVEDPGPVPEPTIDNADLRHGDLRELDLKPGSVDLILTDPPYPREYLEDWTALGDLAAAALRPGRLLVAYSGQYHLPAVIQALGQGSSTSGVERS